MKQVCIRQGEIVAAHLGGICSPKTQFCKLLAIFAVNCNDVLTVLSHPVSYFHPAQAHNKESSVL